MKLFNDIYRNRPVFITGITGFKGSWMALWLAKLGAIVTGYALKPSTDPNHYELLNLNIITHYEDIRNDEKLTNIIKKSSPEIVFHLAAQPLVRYSYANPKETFETNVIGTLNLLEACRKCESVKAIVIITSDKCYDNKEWLWPYRESEPLGGYDPYSASKGCAEILTSCYRNSFFNIDDFNKKHTTLVASCRAGNVIGGGDWSKDRLVPDIIRATVNGVPVNIRNPKAIRPWQYVLEPLQGYLLLAQKLFQKEIKYAEAWNFGPDDHDNKEVGQVVEKIKDKWDKVYLNTGSTVSGPHEAHLLKLDSSKAKMILGWKPVWCFDKAIEMTTNWYKSYYEDNRIITEEQIDAYIHDSIQK